MKRRALLAALGTGFCGIAGCVDTPRGSDDGTTRNGGWTTRPGATTTEPETAAETETPTQKPDPGNVSLTATPESAELPTATVEFTLRNDANTTFAFNPYAYSVTKRTGDEWVNVTPRVVPEPLTLLPPGDENAWTVGIDDTEPSSGTWANSYGESSPVLRGLGPGTYRFGISGWFETDDGVAGSRTGLFAAFELVGDPVELRADPSVTTERRDGTVAVRTDDAHRDVEVVVEPSDYDGVVGTVITEEAYRYVALRNTLPFFGGGVERVVLSTADSMYLLPNGTPYLKYDGSTYRVQVEQLE